jgi:SpoVK/Ycf46/Vps4 family AAA+-type ATPase
VLRELPVLRMAQATNFEVTGDQWDALTDLIDETVEAPATETLTDLGKQLHLEPEDYLLEVEQLLRDKRQVIFYGPPGTGKTYIARNLRSSSPVTVIASRSYSSTRRTRTKISCTVFVPC